METFFFSLSLLMLACVITACVCLSLSFSLLQTTLKRFRSLEDNSTLLKESRIRRYKNPCTDNCHCTSRTTRCYMTWGTWGCLRYWCNGSVSNTLQERQKPASKSFETSATAVKIWSLSVFKISSWAAEICLKVFKSSLREAKIFLKIFQERQKSI